MAESNLDPSKAKLEELKKLFDSNLLSKVEYNALKEEILFGNVTTENKESQEHQNPQSFEVESKSSFPALVNWTIVIVAFFILFITFKSGNNDSDSTVIQNNSTETQINNENSNQVEQNYEVELNDNSNQTSNGSDYRMGRDGRLYETNNCSLCKGTGIETGRNIVTGEIEGRICPMCDGRGVRSY
jgi:DnaJ-class molecular chaperone